MVGIIRDEGTMTYGPTSPQPQGTRKSAAKDRGQSIQQGHNPHSGIGSVGPRTPADSGNARIMGRCNKTFGGQRPAAGSGIARPTGLQRSLISGRMEPATETRPNSSNAGLNGVPRISQGRLSGKDRPGDGRTLYPYTATGPYTWVSVEGDSIHSGTGDLETEAPPTARRIMVGLIRDAGPMTYGPCAHQPQGTRSSSAKDRGQSIQQGHHPHREIGIGGPPTPADSGNARIVGRCSSTSGGQCPAAGSGIARTTVLQRSLITGRREPTAEIRPNSSSKRSSTALPSSMSTMRMIRRTRLFASLVVQIVSHSVRSIFNLGSVPSMAHDV